MKSLSYACKYFNPFDSANLSDRIKGPRILQKEREEERMNNRKRDFHRIFSHDLGRCLFVCLFGNGHQITGDCYEYTSSTLLFRGIACIEILV